MARTAFGYRTFDSDALVAMGEAFDLVCEEHHRWLDIRDREAIACAILEAACDGELRADALYEIALDSLNLGYRRSA